jgi:hypothetical protein
MASALDPTSRVLVITYACGITVANGAVLADAAVMRYTAEALEIAERSSDDFGVATTRWVLGLVLAHHRGADRGSGLDLLATARQTALQQQYSMGAAPMIDIEIAREKLRLGDVDGAVEDAADPQDRAPRLRGAVIRTHTSSSTRPHPASPANPPLPRRAPTCSTWPSAASNNA